MRILLLNQAFYPDVVSTAQHASDLAAKLAQQGHSVTVVASRRAYDDPKLQFARKETWKGVRILRLPCLGLGKKARWRRALNFGSFLASCAGLLLWLRAFDIVVGMTTPPLISFLAALFTRLKGGSFVFWVMDLNPDEALAAGWLRPGSWITRILNTMVMYSLRHAKRVVVLDRYMRQRVRKKGVPDSKIEIIPPWSHDDAVAYDREGRAAFRTRHNISDKYVVMYSGNHSPCHPLDTLLEAALRLANHRDIVFCFVGGGSEFERVKRFADDNGLVNVMCLPYQPLHLLSGSLSAADLHIVVMGDPFVGIVHTCKIYNIMKLGIPFVYIGPPASHIADLVSAAALNGGARLVNHGEVGVVAQHILRSARDSNHSKSAAQSRFAARYGQRVLVARMIETLEATALAKRPAAAECFASSGERVAVGD